MSIIYIAAIVSLNFMGICYGAWNDNLNLNFSMSTGSFKPEFFLDNYKIVRDDGELTLTLSDDNSTLNIEGWCYPSFEDSVSIGIINNGSIPIKQVIFDGNDKDVAIDEEVIDTDLLNLPSRIEVNGSETFVIDIQADDYIIAESLLGQQENYDITELIEKLEQIEDHTFVYELQFEQGQ